MSGFSFMGKLMLLIGLALIVAGCLPSQVQVATKTANTIAPSRGDAEFCVDDVRKRYAPAWKYYNGLRRAWLMLASAIQSAKLINDHNDPRLLPAIAELAEAQKGFSSMANALEIAK